MYSDKFRIRFWFVYDKSRFVRRYEDNRYKDDPNIDQSKEIFRRFYKMLPYIISLLVLAVSSKKSRAPKAERIPYDKGQR